MKLFLKFFFSWTHVFVHIIQRTCVCLIKFSPNVWLVAFIYKNETKWSQLSENFISILRKGEKTFFHSRPTICWPKQDKTNLQISHNTNKQLLNNLASCLGEAVLAHPQRPSGKLKGCKWPRVRNRCSWREAALSLWGQMSFRGYSPEEANTASCQLFSQ